MDDVDDKAPADIAYTFSGYAPLSVRLVEVSSGFSSTSVQESCLTSGLNLPAQAKPRRLMLTTMAVAHGAFPCHVSSIGPAVTSSMQLLTSRVSCRPRSSPVPAGLL